MAQRETARILHISHKSALEFWRMLSARAAQENIHPIPTRSRKRNARRRASKQAGRAFFAYGREPRRGNTPGSGPGPGSGSRSGSGPGPRSGSRSRSRSGSGSKPKPRPTPPVFMLPDVTALDTDNPADARMAEIAAASLSMLSSPIDVISEKQGRGFTKSVRRRTCSKTADLPYRIIDPEHRVASPELVLLQIALETHLVELAQIGCELCGTYRTLDNRPVYHCHPLTTVENLATAFEGMKNLHGAKNARHAVRYILDGAASPMETNLSLLLTLPVRMGGYGLPKPQLNHIILLNDKQSAVYGKTFYRADLCWPEQKLVLEYDGNEHHSGPSNMNRDAIRRNALISMGYTVVCVTYAQFANHALMGKIAAGIARQLGKKARKSDFVPSIERDRLLIALKRSAYAEP